MSADRAVFLLLRADFKLVGLLHFNRHIRLTRLSDFYTPDTALSRYAIDLERLSKWA
jgi:hypothetical protein